MRLTASQTALYAVIFSGLANALPKPRDHVESTNDLDKREPNPDPLSILIPLAPGEPEPIDITVIAPPGEEPEPITLTVITPTEEEIPNREPIVEIPVHVEPIPEPKLEEPVMQHASVVPPEPAPGSVEFASYIRDGYLENRKDGAPLDTLQPSHKPCGRPGNRPGDRPLRIPSVAINKNDDPQTRNPNESLPNESMAPAPPRSTSKVYDIHVDLEAIAAPIREAEEELKNMLLKDAQEELQHQLENRRKAALEHNSRVRHEMLKQLLHEEEVYQSQLRQQEQAEAQRRIKEQMDARERMRREAVREGENVKHRYNQPSNPNDYDFSEHRQFDKRSSSNIPPGLFTKIKATDTNALPASSNAKKTKRDFQSPVMCPTTAMMSLADQLMPGNAGKGHLARIAQFRRQCFTCVCKPTGTGWYIAAWPDNGCTPHLQRACVFAGCMCATRHTSYDSVYPVVINSGGFQTIGMHDTGTGEDVLNKKKGKRSVIPEPEPVNDDDEEGDETENGDDDDEEGDEGEEDDEYEDEGDDDEGDDDDDDPTLARRSDNEVFDVPPPSSNSHVAPRPKNQREKRSDEGFEFPSDPADAPGHNNLAKPKVEKRAPEPEPKKPCDKNKSLTAPIEPPAYTEPRDGYDENPTASSPPEAPTATRQSIVTNVQSDYVPPPPIYEEATTTNPPVYQPPVPATTRADYEEPVVPTTVPSYEEPVPTSRVDHEVPPTYEEQGPQTTAPSVPSYGEQTTSAVVPPSYTYISQPLATQSEASVPPPTYTTSEIEVPPAYPTEVPEPPSYEEEPVYEVPEYETTPVEYYTTRVTSIVSRSSTFTTVVTSTIVPAHSYYTSGSTRTSTSTRSVRTTEVQIPGYEATTTTRQQPQTTEAAGYY